MMETLTDEQTRELAAAAFAVMGFPLYRKSEYIKGCEYWQYLEPASGETYSDYIGSDDKTVVVMLKWLSVHELLPEGDPRRGFSEVVTRYQQMYGEWGWSVALTGDNEEWEWFASRFLGEALAKAIVSLAGTSKTP
jgi:hypothetical protein